MDKIKILFTLQLDKMHNDFVEKINSLPLWELDSFLPTDIKLKSVDEKKIYLIDRFKKNNSVYKMIEEDLVLVQNTSISIEELRSLNIDPRYLESLGLKEQQINEYYKFVNEIKEKFSE
jgi:hypothetical protein